MTNSAFLDCIAQSFKTFLETGSRSNQKLKILHGSIAVDLAEKLGEDYTIKSLGFESGKEGKIQGRYIDKNVDITVIKDKIPVAGVGIKFVMQNYSQNSNNYFENMLGETANIRSNNIPYFQVFIIPDVIPYYKEGGKFQNWETFTAHNAHKYGVLSNDFVETSIHTPTKTLIYVVKLPDINIDISDKKSYQSYYLSLSDINVTTTSKDYGTFASNVIFNDYEEFIQKVVHRIFSI
ncbi:MAG: hypothetical protein RL757_257 [Bacteroidota bacterium]|jgi:hypothetical protein